MNKVLVLAISGAARSGKNTFENILIDLLGPENCYSASFAKKLREDVKDFCKSQFGIDSYTQKTEEKETIRPILIQTAKIKRKQSKGQYFVNSLMKEISSDGFFWQPDIPYELYHEKYKYLIISDLRYCDFYIPELEQGDEVGFVKSFGGKIIYIDQFYYQDDIKKYTPPYGEDETRNNPLIKKYSDYLVDWRRLNINNYDILKEKLIDYVRPVYEEIIKLNK